jgi:hypothetical protein
MRRRCSPARTSASAGCLGVRVRPFLRAVLGVGGEMKSRDGFWMLRAWQGQQ